MNTSRTQGLRVPRKKTRINKTSNGIRILEFSIIFLIFLFFVILGLAIIPFDERPSSGLFYTLGNTLGFSMNEASPNDFIKENQIQIYNDRVVIWIPGANLSRYAATGSMDPVLDYTANGIEIPFTSTSQVNIGDIIAFQPFGSNDLVVHRITDIGYDNDGWYCITKGDNNNMTDGKIREEQIKYITIAIIY